MAVNDNETDKCFQRIKDKLAKLDVVRSSEKGKTWESWLKILVGRAAKTDPNTDEHAERLFGMIVKISNFLNDYNDTEWQAFSEAMLEARTKNQAFSTHFKNLPGFSDLDRFRINELFTNELFYDFI
jgi:hypothetical protein